MQRKEKIILQSPTLFGLLGKELSFRLTLIPSGWYLRGAKNADKEAGKNEKPRHKVKISKPFWMMETQMTEELFLHINPKLKYRSSQPKFPARKVCWYDAVRFCNELSGSGVNFLLAIHLMIQVMMQKDLKQPKFIGNFQRDSDCRQKARMGVGSKVTFKREILRFNNTCRRWIF